jgi:anthranilate phosphoribosyltransferase
VVREALAKVIRRESLSSEDMAKVMGTMLAGGATAAQVGALAAALRMKGETEDEVYGAAQAMRSVAARIHPRAERVIDTCGTGGDGARTINLSTAAAFVVAGAGVTVAKHGNRAVSSQCGSSDVLAALGVPIELPHKEIESAIDTHGIGFLFAPSHHGALRHVADVRREIGSHSIFNLLGPLTNPAGARYHLMGTFDRSRLVSTARVLAKLGSVRAWVVHGHDGLDEVSPCAPTDVASLESDGHVRCFTISPADAGLAPVDVSAIAGGDAKHNARVLLAVLEGERSGARDAVILNASAALVVAGDAKDLREGAALATRSIDTGAARAKLAALARMGVQ